MIYSNKMKNNNPSELRLKDLIPVTGLLDYSLRNDDKASLTYNLKEMASIGYNLVVFGVLAYGFWAGLDKILR